jgi:ankyrin repeat protein
LRGHEKVVQMLLAAGAEVNAQEEDYGNALQAASSEGHEKVVQMLLAVDAETAKNPVYIKPDST